MIEVLCKESSLLITYLFAFLLQSEKLALMESMKQELEEKIRKLEEDKQNMDISAGNVIHNVWRIAHDCIPNDHSGSQIPTCSLSSS